MELETGAELGVALCRAVGIDPAGVAGVKLHCDPDKPAVLLVERLVPRTSMAGPLRVVATYSLQKGAVTPLSEASSS